MHEVPEFGKDGDRAGRLNAEGGRQSIDEGVQVAARGEVKEFFPEAFKQYQFFINDAKGLLEEGMLGGFGAGALGKVALVGFIPIVSSRVIQILAQQEGH